MKNILFLTLSFLFFMNCKKDKLTGDAKTLIGTWTWKSGWGEQYSSPSECGCSRTLTFKEKGKYEIQQDGKNIETGRITYEEATSASGEIIFKIDFHRNNPLTRTEYFVGKCALHVSNDELNIMENIGWTDQPSHNYVRQK